MATKKFMLWRIHRHSRAVRWDNNYRTVRKCVIFNDAVIVYTDEGHYINYESFPISNIQKIDKDFDRWEFKGKVDRLRKALKINFDRGR